MIDEPHGLTRRILVRHAAIGLGAVWTAPVMRSVTLRAASGTPSPSTSNTTGTSVAPPEPTLTFIAAAPCDPNLAFGFVAAHATGLPPNESLALAAGFGDAPPSFILRFATDDAGRATLGRTQSEVPFTSSVRIWRDTDLDGELDDGEEVFIAGRVVADEPCQPPVPVVGAHS